MLIVKKSYEQSLTNKPLYRLLFKMYLGECFVTHEEGYLKFPPKMCPKYWQNSKPLIVTCDKKLMNLYFISLFESLI